MIPRLLATRLGQRLPEFIKAVACRADLAAHTADPLPHRAVLPIGVLDLQLDRLKVAVQPLQLGRRRLQAVLFLLQLLDPVDQRRPIDLGEFAGLVQAGEHLPALDRSVSCLLVLGLLGVDRVEPALESFRPAHQGADLPLVGPAEHIRAPVIDTGPIVLSCRPPAALIWPALVTARGARRKSAMVSTHSYPARLANSRSSQGANGVSLTSSLPDSAVDDGGWTYAPRRAAAVMSGTRDNTIRAFRGW